MAKATAAAATAIDVSNLAQQMVDMTLIEACPTNWRKIFDEKDLTDMAAGMAARVAEGKPPCIQAVKLRRHPKHPGKYEIVFGERRWRAAKLAKLPQVNAVVEDMTDEEVHAEQGAENLQRKDMHALEEADGFAHWHEAPPKGLGWSVERIADKAQVSPEQVWARMKLRVLTDKPRKAFLANEITTEHALLLARMPTKDMQADALKDFYGPDGQVIPIRAARELVHRKYMLRLAKASFDTKDAQLVPAAGPCTTCPKRTGATPMLFPDVGSADVCTDPKCYAGKQDAAWKVTAAGAEAQGKVVLSDRAAKQLFPYQSAELVYNAPVVDLDDKCEADPKRRTYRKLLGDAPVEVNVCRDPTGATRELVPAKEVKQVLRDAGHKFAQERPADKRNALGQTPAESKAAKLRAAQVKAGVAAVVDACEARVGEKGKADDYARVLLNDMCRGGYTNAMSYVVSRRGWKVKGKRPGDIVLAQSRDMSGPQLLALILEVMTSQGAYFQHSGQKYSETLRAGAKAFGVDLDKIADKVKRDNAQRDAERQGKGK